MLENVTLALQSEQLVRSCSSSWCDLILGCASSFPCVSFFCIEGVLPASLGLGVVAGLVMGMFSASGFVFEMLCCCPCSWCCIPCSVPTCGALAPLLGFYIWPCPPGLVWCLIGCPCGSMFCEHCIIGVTPGITFQAIGPCLANLEAKCVFPCVDSLTARLSRFSCGFI
jgi:hypothetical protein